LVALLHIFATIKGYDAPVTSRRDTYISLTFSNGRIRKRISKQGAH